MATKLYVCVMCEEEYESERTDEEAMLEAELIWGSCVVDKRDIVCDDCFPLALSWQGKFVGRS